MKRLFIAALLVACGRAPSPVRECSANAAAYAPELSPSRFTHPTRIDNAFLPLKPGARFQYRDDDGVTTDTVVTADTRTVDGIEAVVVRDTATSKSGEVIEDTFDWFAQDDDGNVWYLGEDTKEFTGGGAFSAAGSWEAGVDCAFAGIVMKAHPALGDSYRQEYRQGSAEDEADVLALNETVTVPYGTFTGCLKTKDYTALEAGAYEHKFYCPGVGLVSSVDVAPVVKREDLVSVKP
jgi:hypothetical protein